MEQIRRIMRPTDVPDQGMEKKNEYSTGDIAQRMSRWQAEVNVRTAGA